MLRANRREAARETETWLEGWCRSHLTVGGSTGLADSPCPWSLTHWPLAGWGRPSPASALLAGRPAPGPAGTRPSGSRSPARLDADGPDRCRFLAPALLLARPASPLSGEQWPLGFGFGRFGRIGDFGHRRSSRIGYALRHLWRNRPN